MYAKNVRSDEDDQILFYRWTNNKISGEIEIKEQSFSFRGKDNAYTISAQKE